MPTKAITAPLIDALSLSSTALTHTFGKAATAVYLPAVHDEALALIISTPARAATDAYYQELLGTSMSALLRFAEHNKPCTP
jgi:hypothetical protein